MNSMKVHVLGCGPSGGVPLVGCDCAVCRSPDPKNRRLRASILIEIKGLRILVDTSPDLREQCLRNQFSTVDAILYTHAHADHCHGIDDVRSLNYHKGGAINVYADPRTLQDLKHRFPYAFRRLAQVPEGWYSPLLTPYEVMIEKTPVRFRVADKVEVLAFVQHHGGGISLGYRIENFAYSTDVNNLPEESMPALDHLDLWLVDCLRYHKAPSHAHWGMTLEWIARVRPRRAVLTHMGHELEYAEMRRALPQGVEPAWDGMVLELPVQEKLK
jgi:phosphoribosyl 1,2-cyclic phosphate phosphodiesterase